MVAGLCVASVVLENTLRVDSCRDNYDIWDKYLCTRLLIIYKQPHLRVTRERERNLLRS
jgi:hypothetical protein